MMKRKDNYQYTMSKTLLVVSLTMILVYSVMLVYHSLISFSLLKVIVDIICLLVFMYMNKSL